MQNVDKYRDEIEAELKEYNYPHNVLSQVAYEHLGNEHTYIEIID